MEIMNIVTVHLCNSLSFAFMSSSSSSSSSSFEYSFFSFYVVRFECCSTPVGLLLTWLITFHQFNNNKLFFNWPVVEFWLRFRENNSIVFEVQWVHSSSESVSQHWAIVQVLSRALGSPKSRVSRCQHNVPLPIPSSTHSIINIPASPSHPTSIA